MSKKSLKLSNQAHERLKKKHYADYEKTGSKKSHIKWLYHFNVIYRQNWHGEKLTKAEKNYLFHDAKIVLKNIHEKLDKSKYKGK